MLGRFSSGCPSPGCGRGRRAGRRGELIAQSRQLALVRKCAGRDSRGLLGLGSNVGDRRRTCRPRRMRSPAAASRCSPPPRSTRPSPSAKCSSSPTSTRAFACGPRWSRRRCSTPARRCERELGRDRGRRSPRAAPASLLLLRDETHSSERLERRTAQVTAAACVLVPLLELEPRADRPGPRLRSGCADRAGTRAAVRRARALAVDGGARPASPWGVKGPGSLVRRVCTIAIAAVSLVSSGAGSRGGDEGLGVILRAAWPGPRRQRPSTTPPTATGSSSAGSPPPPARRHRTRARGDGIR